MESQTHFASLAIILLDAQGNPRRAAIRSLDWLLNQVRARSVALWRVEDGEIALSLGVGIDSLSEATSRDLWKVMGDSDAPAWGEDGTAVLLRIPKTDMLLYADGVKRSAFDLMPALLNGGTVAAMALLRRSVLPFDGDGGMSTVKKEELLAALNLHEWNIARVARATGVTRKTVYDRMDRYGIERQRVPK